MATPRATRQRFSIGYHLNSWDLTGQPLRPALDFLTKQGFGWFEILAFTSLSDQFARKYMQLGHQGPMGVMTDTDILRRYAILSEAQSELGIRLSSLYVNATFTNPVLWPVERDVLVSLARLLKATSKFGAQMDSLADIVNFGVAPALVLYAFLLDRPARPAGSRHCCSPSPAACGLPASTC